MLQEAFGVSGGIDHRPALALGGGLSRAGDVCGVITGGAVAIGLLVGDHIFDFRPAKRRAYELTRPFYRDFVAQFGHADCLSLIGMELDSEEGRRAFEESGLREVRCTRFVAFAVRRLLPVSA